MQQYKSFSPITVNNIDTGESSQWAELWAVHMTTEFVRRNRQMHGFSLIHGLWAMDWLDAQGLGESLLRKLVRKTSRKEVCD